MADILKPLLQHILRENCLMLILCVRHFILIDEATYLNMKVHYFVTGNFSHTVSKNGSRVLYCLILFILYLIWEQFEILIKIHCACFRNGSAAHTVIQRTGWCRVNHCASADHCVGAIGRFNVRDILAEWIQ